MTWTVIALTARSKRDSATFLNEFTKRQKAGLIDANTYILAVPDPGHGDGRSVGSGGATLNALLAVAEYLSALAGHTVVNADTLLNARVLLLHMGGKPFTTFASTTASKDNHRELLYNVDLLLQTINTLTDGTPPGVWVSSTEMLLRLPESRNESWNVSPAGVTVVAVPGTAAAAERHGVYKLDTSTGAVHDLIYRGSAEEISSATLSSGDLALVSGIAFICPATAEKLLALTITYPLNACTYLGADDGAESFTLSFFLDVLKCMCKDVTVERVESEDTIVGISNPKRLKARSVLWKQLSGISMSAVVLNGASFVYIPTSPKDQSLLHYPTGQLRNTSSIFAMKGNVWSRRTRAFVQSEIHEECVVVNSLIRDSVQVAKDAVICHSRLNPNWNIGAGAYVYGIADTATGIIKSRNIYPDIAIREHRICLQPDDSRGDVAVHNVWTVLGFSDTIDTTPGQETLEPCGTFCNQPWADFSSRTGIEMSDLWSTDDKIRTAGTAKIFPVITQGSGGPITIDDILWMQKGANPPTEAQLQRWRLSWRLSYRAIMKSADITSEVKWQNDLSYAVQDEILKLTLTFPESGEKGKKLAHWSGLTEEDWCLLPYFSSCAIDDHFDVFNVLDDVASNTKSPGIAARTLACIADLLGQFAFGKGGLRSGPGRNNAFKTAFDMLEAENLREGVPALAKQRQLWLHSPDSFIRAARHYESAAQILIRRAVMTVREFIKVGQAEKKSGADGTWTKAEAAARIDISGGWTDTPPVTYEHGGAVVNAAVLIDGKRPIGSKVRRIPEFKLTLVMGDQRLDVTDKAQLATYTQPQSPGALLKAAFCCARIVSIDVEESLAEQLENVYGCGFELHTWSNLPQGSGMGTSSILAGTVMAALWNCAGFQYDNDSLIHAVCLLEQMLTTGGGWQDQVGGIVAGFKIARSAGQLPLLVETEMLSCSPSFVDKFNKHLVLIYTGKTRLARNLLQNVIRNWYARNPELVLNADALTSNAEDCRKAFANEDLGKIGECLNNYWEQKKLMAPGCEPAFVKSMMDVMRPHAYGQSMAGAGGGGFMYVITKEPNMSTKMEELVREAIPGVDDVKFHDVCIDESGIIMTNEA